MKWISINERLPEEFQICFLQYTYENGNTGMGGGGMIDFENLLLNLLAVIHRDGGQHTGKYGVEVSVIDATQIVADAIVKEEMVEK